MSLLAPGSSRWRRCSPTELPAHKESDRAPTPGAATSRPPLPAGRPACDRENHTTEVHSKAPAAAIPHAAPVIPYRRASPEARTSVLVCPTAWDQRIPPPRRLALRRREKPIVIASK